MSLRSEQKELWEGQKQVNHAILDLINTLEERVKLLEEKLQGADDQIRARIKGPQA